MIPTVRAFIAGVSDSGKSTRAWHLYLARMPRRIIFDQTGEWEQVADAVTLTVRDGVEAIRAFARRGTWTVTIAGGPSELEQLVDWMIPVPRIIDSPILKLGGAVVLIDEADLVAPPGTSYEYVRTLARRSRHAGLSCVFTTQRPENVSREVSAQCNHLIALRLNEPRAMDYMARAMGWTNEERRVWISWTRRHPHGGVWRDVRKGVSALLPEAGPPQLWRQHHQMDAFSSPSSSTPHDGGGAPPDHTAASASARRQGSQGHQHPTQPETSGDDREDGQGVDPLLRARRGRW